MKGDTNLARSMTDIAAAVQRAEAHDRYVYLDGVEVAHCSDVVAAELIAFGLNLCRLDDNGKPRLDQAGWRRVALNGLTEQCVALGGYTSEAE